MVNVMRLVRQAHNLLGQIVGAQVLLWVASGLFFTLQPIETVRGEHLRAGPGAALPPLPEGGVAIEDIVATAGEPVQSIRLKPWLDGAVWEVMTGTGTEMFDAATGARLTPVAEADARRVAEAGWAGDGVLAGLSLIEEAPREAGRGFGRAMWRAEFEGKDKATFWIDPEVGDIAAVRTEWWRAFDLFWGLHIMDWTGRETISTWWMKLFAFASLVLTLAGIWLVIDRLMKGRLLK